MAKVPQERKTYEAVPAARKAFLALRDFGYKFEEAVADLVDNSVEHGSTTVRIEAVWEGPDSYVHIMDNGSGMGAAQLREALRHGSNSEYEEDSLGKFGFGLKSASLSQCDVLTVSSRQNPKQANIYAYAWDTDYIVKTNSWEILEIPTKELHATAAEHLRETVGTVVTWYGLRFLQSYKKPDGEHAKKGFYDILKRTEQHLAMVFHRFLSGEVKGRRLILLINNKKVEPWDPFARRGEKTKSLDPQRITFDTGTAKGTVVFEPYVLPAERNFSSPTSFAYYSGPERWNKQQGFYIYRADRMIQSGGWCGIRTQDEHTKLARIAISFPTKLDEAFKINVSKTAIILPSELKDVLKTLTEPVIRIAKDEYNPRRDPAISPAPLAPLGKELGSPSVSDPTTPSKPSNPSVLKSKSKLDVDQLELLLLAFAKEPGEKQVIKLVAERMRSHFEK
jgi:hypothetical protein